MILQDLCFNSFEYKTGYKQIGEYLFNWFVFCFIIWFTYILSEIRKLEFKYNCFFGFDIFTNTSFYFFVSVYIRMNNNLFIVFIFWTCIRLNFSDIPFFNICIRIFNIIFIFILNFIFNINTIFILNFVFILIIIIPFSIIFILFCKRITRTLLCIIFHSQTSIFTISMIDL